MKVQAITFTLAETSSGLVCSCISVISRIYHQLAWTPPYKGEEYQLRKFKRLVSHMPESNQREGFDAANGILKSNQESRNLCKYDIEAPDVLGKPHRTNIMHIHWDAGN